MKKLFVVLCVLAISSVALAIDPQAISSGFQKGDKEISGNLSVMNSSGSDMDMTMWMALGSFGYFITPHIQLKGSGMIFGTKAEDTTILDGSFGIGADYLFLTKRMNVIPYAGGDILLSVSKMDSGSTSSTDVGAGVDIHGGVKQFISDNTAISYEIRLMRDSATDSTWVIGMIGLNVYLQ
jgi:hypothetical protein